MIRGNCPGSTMSKHALVEDVSVADDNGGAGQRSFDSLPNEMVLHVLRYVDADTLLSCRPVSKLWRELVDRYAFQEKAAEENKWVNGGRGYRSFSQVDADTVMKLDLPWFVFYVICKHDPFNRNLVDYGSNLDRNQNYNFKQCTVDQLENVPEVPNDPDFEDLTYYFVTSQHCVGYKTKTVVFERHGLTKKLMMFLQPEIVVSEWHVRTFKSPYMFQLDTILSGRNHQYIEESHRNIKTNLNEVKLHKPVDDFWTKVTHTFENTSIAYTLSLELVGFNTIVLGCAVKVVLPVNLKSA